MRAVLCRQFGSPEELVIEETAIPQPGPRQVLIRVEAAGVNAADVVVIGGTYQEKPPLPFVPGSEVAGRITAMGGDVRDRKVGDRVAAQIDSGGFGEFAAIDADRLVALPDGIPSTLAAASMITFGTAYGCLRWRAQLKPGETCLVLGGAGGVGLATISTAKAMGGRVIGAASSAERCRLMTEQGADATIDYGSVPLREAVLELTGSKGADIIIDPVGGDLGALALRCIAWEGRIVTLGFLAGSVPKYPANILMVKNVAALGMYFGSYVKKRPEAMREACAFIYDGFMAGTLRPAHTVEATLDDVPGFLALLRDRRQTGKVVVRM